MLVNEREFVSVLPWLHGKLRLGEDINLYNLVCSVRAGEIHKYYKVWNLGSRIIHEPLGELKIAQRHINENLLSSFPKPESSFGFSGGNCLDAAHEHNGFQSMLMLDLRDAFSQVNHQKVYKVLYGGPWTKRKYLLSHYCAMMVADLCTVGEVKKSKRDSMTWGGILPQGPSSSPRLFDLVMAAELDKLMLSWAKRRNFGYVRYADNLYFSSRHPFFPPKQRAIILSEVGKSFSYHKVRQVDGGAMCRMLGLNVWPDRICNTREFKRAFRGALYNVEYTLENSLPHEEAWNVAKGYWGFAVRETLPESLAEKFAELQKQIHLLDWGW